VTIIAEAQREAMKKSLTLLEAISLLVGCASLRPTRVIEDNYVRFAHPELNLKIANELRYKGIDADSIADTNRFAAKREMW
jgi:hypothetical protein